MAVKPSDDAKLKWQNVRIELSRAISFARSKEFAEGAAGVTLQSSIADAILELDSQQGDDIETLGDEQAVVQDSSLYGSGRGKGKLQRVQDLMVLYFGDGTTPGLFAEVTALPDPTVR